MQNEELKNVDDAVRNAQRKMPLLSRAAFRADLDALIKRYDYLAPIEVCMLLDQMRQEILYETCE